MGLALPWAQRGHGGKQKTLLAFGELWSLGRSSQGPHVEKAYERDQIKGSRDSEQEVPPPPPTGVKTRP